MGLPEKDKIFPGHASFLSFYPSVSQLFNGVDACLPQGCYTFTGYIV
ncbi:MAG TPA: hypothetical protein PKC69_00470 [Chitinophagaceae bacterium]|nr:hypothetical protein [Chitinophagaceae bacterium]